MKNLKIIIIDEVSMVKADMLYQLDLRLQEITERVGVPFGGTAIFAFGDMMQLKPCMGKYIHDEPQNIDFKVTHSLNPRWKMFKCITLEVNHRQGNDKAYADLLNRLRIGAHTQEDISLLQSRVRPANHPDIKEANLHIVCKRKECARINLERMTKIKREVISIHAIHHHATQKSYKPLIDSKEGTVASTSFINELQLKIGAKIMLIHNIDTVDCLTNGQLGQLVEVIKTTDGKIDKLIVKLHNTKAGKQNRQNHPALAAKHPDCVFIERVSNQYTLRKKGGVVGTTATVIQFPVKLAFAITSHKIQGQTIPSPKTVALDTESIFEDAQAYVMLSRVQQIDQVFIVEKFSESKIRTSQVALEETKRLQNISMNKNPSPWDAPDDHSLKVMTVNCAGLKAHIEDIKTDAKIMKADMIQLIETSLDENEINPLILSGYEVENCSIRNGMGISTYYKGSKFKSKSNCVTSEIQVTNFSTEDIQVITVYRSSRGSLHVLKEKLKDIISKTEKAVLITGDFNLCYMSNQKNIVSKYLEDEGFQQKMKGASHVKGGHIDHVYWRNGVNVWTGLILETYSPYYTDHDASLVTLTGE